VRRTRAVSPSSDSSLPYIVVLLPGKAQDIGSPFLIDTGNRVQLHHFDALVTMEMLMAITSPPRRTLIAGSQQDEGRQAPLSVLTDTELSRKAILVYGLLVKDRDMSEADIARDLGCSERHVRNLISQLVKRGHLEILRIRGLDRRCERVLTGLDRIEKAS